MTYKILSFGKKLTMLISSLSHNPYFWTTLRKEACENNLAEGENAGNQHFLLFPKCFLSFQKQISIFSVNEFVLSKSFHFRPIWNFVFW